MTVLIAVNVEFIMFPTLINSNSDYLSYLSSTMFMMTLVKSDINRILKVTIMDKITSFAENCETA